MADAIIAANTDTATGGCPAGSGHDTIILETDVILDDPELVANARPPIVSSITIEGQGSIINGNYADWPVLTVTSDGNLILNETTVIGAYHISGDGGGIHSAGTITMTNSRVEENYAGSGGGIYNAGTLTMTKCTVNTNQGGNPNGGGGGGIYNASGGILTLNKSTVNNNFMRGPNGGGISNDGIVNLNNSTISGNWAGCCGGGISNNGTVNLNSSTISDNEAGWIGGGILTSYYGGAILNNSIISGNTAPEGNEIAGRATSVAFNVLGHSGESYAEAFTSLVPSPEDIIATSDGTDSTTLSAILSPLTDNGGPTQTHALVPGSPAIDLDPACSTGLTEDQREELRPIGEGCDAGAFEFSSVIIVDAGGICTLADAITSANTDIATGGCPAGLGHDTILLETHVALLAELSAIYSRITIEGQGRSINGNFGDWPVLTVTSDGNLTLNEIAVIGAYHISGDGWGVHNAGTIIMTKSKVEENYAGNGGGIYNAGIITMTKCTVNTNQAENFHGGGVYNTVGGVVILNNSTVNNNFMNGAGGGGICNRGTVTLNNSTISKNWAVGFGGGIHNYYGTVTLNNSTISENWAGVSGGGISLVYSGSVTLNNSIISGNTAPEGNEVYNDTTGNGAVMDEGFNLFGHGGEITPDAFYGFIPGDNNVVATSDGTNPTALSAILSPLADNGGPTMTHALVPGSPAIDLDATCSTGLTIDQRGEPRPLGKGCDAGSFEASVGPSNSTAFLPAIYLFLLQD